MANERPSAAASVYPHLRSHAEVNAARAEPQRGERNRLAESMYPGHKTLAPKPQRRLSHDELKDQWGDYLSGLMGLHRKR